MSAWLVAILSALGGGFGVKLLELISFRDRDAAEFRRDLLKDIGALRQRCEQLEQKTERLEKELHTVEAENVGLKVEVNTLLGRLGEPAKYPIEVILRPKPTQ
jgi:chromosome segregation ATPase